MAPAEVETDRTYARQQQAQADAVAADEVVQRELVAFIPEDAEVAETRIPSDGGEFITLTEVNPDAREKTHRLVDVLPGGEAALFTLGDADIDTFDDAAIAALSLDSGKYRVLFEGGTNPYYIPSGHLVYARDGSLLAVPFDASSLELRELRSRSSKV